MAKKKKSRGPRTPVVAAEPEAPRPGRERRDAAKAVATAIPVEEPRFWFGYEVAWAKLAIARVVLFGLLAVDALLQIRHAPRYGAGGFNLANVPGLDAIGPTRVSYEIAQLMSSYLFVLAALGVAIRFVLPCVTALYAWMYFTSQLDGYQHHYLVALILGIACFVPWCKPTGAEPGTKIRTWAIRLILVQLAILYLWAAISKMDPAWVDGRTLAKQVVGPLRSLIDGTVGIAWAARLTIVVELTLAVTVWLRPAWWIALPLGVMFHLGIVASGLEIGLFAWVMLALYVLVAPDRLWVAAADSPPGRALRRVLARLSPESDLAAGIAAIGGVAGATVAAYACRFEHALVVAVVLALVPIAIVVVRRIRGGAIAGIAHLLAILVWLAVDRTTTVGVEYYRYWAGSTRRLDDRDTSERAYRKLLDIAPDDESAHYQLGVLLLRRGADDEALDELHRAQTIEPRHARNFLAEARYLASKGKKPEAIEKAREATYAEPGDKQAQDLLDALTTGKRKKSPRPAADDSE